MANEAKPNPFDAGTGMRAAALGHEIAPFTGVPTMAGSQSDLLPGEDGYAYLRVAPLAGNPLLQKACGLTEDMIASTDLPKNRDGTQRDRTGICAMRRDIFGFLNEAQQAAAMIRHKQSRFYREGSKPKIWAGDDLMTLDSGVVLRCHLLIELAKDARQANAAEAEGGDGQNIDEVEEVVE